MEDVGVDDPSGDIAVLYEVLGRLAGFHSLLHARTFPSWAAPGKQAVVLYIKVELYVLCNHIGADAHGIEELEDTFVCTMVNEGSP